MSVEAELQESVSYTPIQRMRHSAAHVMAQAVLELFPDAQLAIGPAIEDGFYYDFDLPRPLKPSSKGTSARTSSTDRTRSEQETPENRGNPSLVPPFPLSYRTSRGKDISEETQKLV